MLYKRMPIEIEAPEEKGYNTIKFNLAESSVRDIPLKNINVDLSELVLVYGEHKGKTELREAILANSNLDAANVLVTPSAATALFIIHTTLLSKDDHLIVIRPNYGTNLETPRAIGCELSVIDLNFEQGFELEIANIKAALKSNTKLISITTPHNPTGTEISTEKIKEIIAIAEKQNCYVLVDETYRDLNFQTPLKQYYAELSSQVISVCSLSKAFGAPGIRTGWIINKNEKLLNDFLAAKEQVIICNSVVDEEIAQAILQQENSLLTATHAHIRENFSVLKNWMQSQPYFEWIEPTAGVVCFPRIKEEYKINLELFHALLYEKYGTVVGPGHWFEKDKSYMRIGFGYPEKDELQTGLQNLILAMEECLTNS